VGTGSGLQADSSAAQRLTCAEAPGRLVGAHRGHSSPADSPMEREDSGDAGCSSRGPVAQRLRSSLTRWCRRVMAGSARMVATRSFTACVAEGAGGPPGGQRADRRWEGQRRDREHRDRLPGGAGALAGPLATTGPPEADQGCADLPHADRDQPQDRQLRVAERARPQRAALLRSIVSLNTRSVGLRHRGAHRECSSLCCCHLRARRRPRARVRGLGDALGSGSDRRARCVVDGIARRRKGVAQSTCGRRVLRVPGHRCSVYPAAGLGGSGWPRQDVCGETRHEGVAPHPVAELRVGEELTVDQVSYGAGKGPPGVMGGRVQP
jgi:hypothetical protein